MTKMAGSGSRSGSISLRHGSAVPDPHQQNVMDSQHWFKGLCGAGERGGDAEVSHAVPAGRSANRFEPAGASFGRRGRDQAVHVRH